LVNGFLFAMSLTLAHTSMAVETNLALLQFVEPTNNAVFSTLDEVPIMLRASAPDDVFLTADVLANNGGYDAEASEDLRTWTRLGPFLPGNVAAFYYDDPPPDKRDRRFYRSVRVQPRLH
jgi:hypothetical protein